MPATLILAVPALATDIFSLKDTEYRTVSPAIAPPLSIMAAFSARAELVADGATLSCRYACISAIQGRADSDLEFENHISIYDVSLGTSVSSKVRLVGDPPPSVLITCAVEISIPSSV